MLKNINAIILAAGKGTRMKSRDDSRSKVAYPIFGVPLVQYVLRAVKPLIDGEIYTVIGFAGEHTKKVVESDITEAVWQREQKGTGHAVIQVKPYLAKKKGVTFILCGDTPLLTTATLENMLQDHEKKGHDLTVMTAVLENPHGYGRIIRSKYGLVERIIEQADSTDEQKNIKEVNAGVYVIDNEKLFEQLENLSTENAQGEMYLTDLIGLFRKKGYTVGASVLQDSTEMLGINNRAQLAEATEVLKMRINKKHMLNGVTIIDPQNTYIGPFVTIGADTTILPGTSILGKCKIGFENTIGPNSYLENVTIGDKNKVLSSWLMDTEIGDNNEIGPFTKTRANTKIGSSCRIGNFVELKNAVLKDGVKAAHLSYLGDTDIGEKANIGCGTITANYDGVHKFHTEIKENVFIGSGTILIAPITVEKGAYTAAGSTINKDVPENALAIARARQENKENYAEIIHNKKK
ncbi:MAG: bifunctional UDP-N-acetylglucosamine diphosphorylase/glucosamine-1-phosphate N-acetyltransferase GlmU [Bacilli bacterium]|jgi:bifunctional UDP-N-acetylglucosamine pyrophosphorylase/glucosamine-1-phosphate N-acetyltransferase